MATKLIKGTIRVLIKQNRRYTIVSLPVDSLPRSRKLRVLASVRNKKFNTKAYSFSNWCMTHIPVEVAKQLNLKNNDKVTIKIEKILAK
ncbi:MAG: hypothetical protein ACE5J2_03285 [Nitrososphaerales archaeon]